MQILYLGRYGKSKTFKLGQTSTSLSQRNSVIRSDSKKAGFKYATKYHTIASISFENMSYQEALYIESYLRLTIARKGYKVFGNDHIEYKGRQTELIALFMETVNKAYNSMSEI